MEKLAHPGHVLEDHLRSIADRASAFSTSLDASDWAGLAGLWHDMGKYRPGFQRYIRAIGGGDAHLETLPGKIKHAIVGAIHAASLGADGRHLAYPIAGHHAGLPDYWHLGNGGGALSQEIRGEGETLSHPQRSAPVDRLLPRERGARNRHTARTWPDQRRCLPSRSADRTGRSAEAGVLMAVRGSSGEPVPT